MKEIVWCKGNTKLFISGGTNMKRTKLLMLGAALLPFAVGLTACNGGNTDIGILQFGEFAALDNARKGFVDGLKEAGFGDLKIDYQNAKAKGADNTTLAKTMASKKHKLNLAIATPCATALKAAQDAIGSTTPLLFTATTDPVGAGLLTNKEAPEGFVTGTSDLQPAEALNNQVKLVKKMIPTATKLGIFYCSSEQNSRVQADLAEEVAEAEGLTVTRKTCTDQFDIKAGIADLAAKVDAIWIPTDNTVANNMAKVKDGLGTNKTLVIVGEEGMLNGGQVTVSISYYDLGKKTAELAAKVLNGTPINEIPVFFNTVETCSYIYNKTNLTDAGFAVSDLPAEFPWSEAK